MGDAVVRESWHINRTLSDETLRLLTALPEDEIERRLRTAPAPAEGEVAEVVEGIRALSYDDLASSYAANLLIRATDLLMRLSATQPPRPIPVSERLPGPEDCGMSAGGWFGSSCWCWHPPYALGGIGWWSIEPFEWTEDVTHWLPANALPLPEAQS